MGREGVVSDDGFEVVEPGQIAFAAGLSEDECSIRRDGTLVAREEAFGAVGIAAGWCIVLADPGTLRLAVRAPHNATERVASGRALSPVLREKKPTGRLSVNVRRALQRMGVEPHAAAGRYKLLTRGDLLIADLGQATDGGSDWRSSTGQAAGERTPAADA